MGGTARARLIATIAAAVLLGAALLALLNDWQQSRALAVLRVGVLPDQAAPVLERRYAPLLGHLQERLGMEVRLVVPDNYDDLVELFAAGAIDIAYFGGLTFLRANKRHGAKPMVMRDVDLDFRTVFLVREESPARAIEAFEGRRFAFGSEDSTSGHLMPRHFLRERGIRPEAFFSTVRYSGAHDTSALWVQQGVVDLSAANGLVVEAMRAQSRLDGVRVLWESPGYPDYVWAAQGALAEPLRERIVAAFLELSPGDPEQRAILESVGAGGFVPARLSDFRSLSQIAAELGFL